MSVTDNRPARNTPNLNLPVPGDSEPADAHQDIGDLADAIDALAGHPISPTGGQFWSPGDIKTSAAAAPTAGWLLCDGRAVEREVYDGLFEAIGTAYGAGDGENTFNLPDFLDRFPMGEATPANLGRKGGEADHVITPAEMPNHAHGTWTGTESADHAHYTSGQSGGRSAGHVHWTGLSIGGSASVILYAPGGLSGHGAWGAPGTTYGDYQTGGENVDHSHAFAAWSGGRSAAHQHQITAEGGNVPHNNLPPFQSVNYFIKT